MKLREFNESKTMPFNNNYIYKSEHKQKSFKIFDININKYYNNIGFNKIINPKQMNQSNAFSLNINKKNINKNVNRVMSEKSFKKIKM